MIIVQDDLPKDRIWIVSSTLSVAFRGCGHFCSTSAKSNGGLCCVCAQREDDCRVCWP